MRSEARNHAQMSERGTHSYKMRFKHLAAESTKISKGRIKNTNSTLTRLIGLCQLRLKPPLAMHCPYRQVVVSPWLNKE